MPPEILKKSLPTAVDNARGSGGRDKVAKTCHAFGADRVPAAVFCSLGDFR